MQVMFVDDESRILAGIERALVMLDRDWEIRLANSGQEALAALEKCPADVVVSDMRMPFMDGAQLLTQVRERWPASIRIILTGHSDIEANLRMLDVAHQFVSKPCDNAILLSAVESAMGLRSLFQHPAVVDMVGNISRLPAAPKVFADLCQLIADPASNARQISDLLSCDPALVAKILQLANSAYFGGGNAIYDMDNAIRRLGLESVRLLVLAAQVFANGAGDPAIDHLQRRSLRASRVAARIAGPAGPAPTAALLAHLAMTIPELREAPMNDTASGCDAPMHAAVGAYLLGLWGLPMDIVDAVAWHHHPARRTVQEFALAGVVHVAVALANGEEPDFDYLEKVRVLKEWPKWQEFCKSTEKACDD